MKGKLKTKEIFIRMEGGSQAYGGPETDYEEKESG